METTFTLPVTINYWDIVRNMSIEAKKTLIAALQTSIKEDEESHALVKDDTLLERITAPWPDDGLTADEFVALCESGRNINREITTI